MPQKELQATLSQLHQELESAEQIDDDARDALVQAMNDIREALERSDDPPEEEPLLSGRIREMVSQFESEHPTFAEMLHRLSEGLATLGI